MGNLNLRQDQTTVLIRDHDRFVKLSGVNEWDAITMLAAVSSAPRSFHELDLAWQRYRSDQRLENLAWQAADTENPAGPWLLIDLACQRMVSNDPEMIPNGPAGFQRDKGKWDPSIPVVWFNLPPWWKTCVETRLETGLFPLPRWHEPVDFRGILYGRPLADALSERMLAIVDTEFVPECYLQYDDLPLGSQLDKTQKQTMSRWYELTVRVHADWLMTPRADLGGKPPRHFLHDGRHWADREIENRQTEWAKLRQPPKALDRDTFAYRHGSMGTAEVVMYFELCRELLSKGWRYLCEPTAERSQLNVMLHEAGRHWLTQAALDGDPTPPAEIIENSRRHMPQVASEEAHFDCNCPICRMMAEQSDLLGPAFCCFDGHHLELDDEFAFSLCETIEEWQMQQADFQEMTERFGDEQEASKEFGAENESENESDDEFASVWKSSFVADELLGGPGVSTMALAFRVSELVTDLQLGSADHDQVDRLNELFDAVRHAELDWPQRRNAVGRLQDYLEGLATACPQMTGKIADFQSQLDEWCRRPLNDIPF